MCVLLLSSKGKDKPHQSQEEKVKREELNNSELSSEHHNSQMSSIFCVKTQAHFNPYSLSFLSPHQQSTMYLINYSVDRSKSTRIREDLSRRRRGRTIWLQPQPSTRNNHDLPS